MNFVCFCLTLQCTFESSSSRELETTLAAAQRQLASSSSVAAAAPLPLPRLPFDLLSPSFAFFILLNRALFVFVVSGLKLLLKHDD